MKRLGIVLAVMAAFSVQAEARTRIVVVSDRGSRDAVFEQIAQLAVTQGGSDRLLVYAAHPFTRLAEIRPPAELDLNKAQIKARLAQLIGPVRTYLLAAPDRVAKGQASQLLIPEVMGELARNVIPTLPEKRADILLLGTLNPVDAKDGRWSMTNRYYPSDGLLKLQRAETPYGTASAKAQLSQSTVYYCYPDSEAEFATTEHEERVRRWWAVWTAAQAGKAGGFSKDIATCFARLRSGDTSGQPAYPLHANEKPKMLRAPGPTPSSPPTSYTTPGEYFLGPNVTIATTPPRTTVGIAWIGILWLQSCDLDLYVRSNAAAKWLYFGEVRTEDGFFNKDIRTGSEQGQFEYVETTRPIDVTKADVAINL